MRQSQPEQLPEQLPEHGRMRRRVIGLLGLGAVGASGAGLWRVFAGTDAGSSDVAPDTVEVSAHPTTRGPEALPTISSDPEDRSATPPTSVQQPGPEVTETTALITAEVLVEVVSRDAWGAAPPVAGLVEHIPVRLTLHHTAVEQTDLSQGRAKMRQHQTYHQSLGWPDLAYHFVVDRAGVAFEGRDVRFRGDTGTEYDPDGHFLVCMEGNFDVQEPAPEQVATMTRLFAWAADAFDIEPTTIAGHSAYAATSCPGAAAQALLPTLAASIAAAPPVVVSIVGAQDR